MIVVVIFLSDRYATDWNFYSVDIEIMHSLRRSLQTELIHSIFQRNRILCCITGLGLLF